MKTVHNLGSLLDSLQESTSGEKVSVGAMLDAVGRRSYGPLLLLLGFVSISPLTIIPGANWLVALIILLIADRSFSARSTPGCRAASCDSSFRAAP